MGFLSDLIDKLNKNKISSLKAKDIISAEKDVNKRKTKKNKLIAALAKTTKLNQLDLRAYDKSYHDNYLFSLSEIITAITANKSIQTLELSCNTLSDEITQVFLSVFNNDVQQIPIKHLYLDELTNDPHLNNNLNSIINSLINNKFLKSLSLRFNTLSSDVCNSLITMIQNKHNSLTGLCLEYCIISATDLSNLRQACLQKKVSFTLNINHVLTNSADTVNDVFNKASFSKILTALPQRVISKHFSINHDASIASKIGQIAIDSTAQHTDNNEHIIKQPNELNLTNQTHYYVTPCLQ